MGVFTPNIGLYIPAAGETNYSDAFAAGMMNLDSHDHSGGPNKGLPINSTGLGDHSVTFEKLAANVADITTGIGVNNTVGSQYQLQMLGVLRNLFTFASTSGGTGIIAVNGSTVYGRTLQNSLDGSITWTFPDGVGGNPLPAFNIAEISPVPVENGGTGVTSFNAWDIICGGTTTTGPLQQVEGEGTIGQNLTSQGPTQLPIWANPSLSQASVTLTAAQFNALSVTPISLVPAPGVGMVLVPVSIYALLTYGSTPFSGGGAVRIIYGSDVPVPVMSFPSTAFVGASSSGYYWTNSFTSSGIAQTLSQNQALYLTNGTATTGGTGSTVTFVCAYYTLTL